MVLRRNSHKSMLKTAPFIGVMLIMVSSIPHSAACSFDIKDYCEAYNAYYGSQSSSSEVSSYSPYSTYYSQSGYIPYYSTALSAPAINTQSSPTVVVVNNVNVEKDEDDDNASEENNDDILEDILKPILSMCEEDEEEPVYIPVPVPVPCCCDCHRDITDLEFPSCECKKCRKNCNHGNNQCKCRKKYKNCRDRSQTSQCTRSFKPDKCFCVPCEKKRNCDYLLHKKY